MRYRNGKFNVARADQRRWNGRTYGSKAEMLRAQHWRMLLEAGSVIQIIEQPRLWLGVPENVYVPDFFILQADGCALFEDVKGQETAKFRRDKKLWAFYGRLPLWVTKQRGSRFEVVEIIAPNPCEK